MNLKAFRGGSWVSNAWYLRVSCRYGLQPVVRFVDIGFRLVERPDVAVRGGSWNLYPVPARCVYRNYVLPAERDDNIGFRLKESS